MHRLVSFRVQKNVRKAVDFLASTEDWQVPGRCRRMPAWCGKFLAPADARMEWQMPGRCRRMPAWVWQVPDRCRRMRWEPANALLFCESVQHFFVDCKTFFNFFVADCKRRQKADNIRTCNRS